MVWRQNTLTFFVGFLDKKLKNKSNGFISTHSTYSTRNTNNQTNTMDSTTTDGQACMDKAEVLTPANLAKRIKTENMREVYSLVPFYGDRKYKGYYHVYGSDKWVTGPKEGNPEASVKFRGIGYVAWHNTVTDRITVKHGGKEWFVGYLSVLVQDDDLDDAIGATLREMGYKFYADSDSE